MVQRLLPRYTARVDIGGIASGTGFFVAPGLVLTCAHVVEENTGIPTTWPVTIFWDGQSYSVQIEEFLPNPYPDLALLHTSDLSEHPCVYLDCDVQLDDKLFSYGYVKAFNKGASADFYYEGEANEGHTEGTDFLQLKDAQARPGLSGAPLLNRRTGTVCGIVKRTRDEDFPVGGYAVPADTILSRFSQLRLLQSEFHRRDRRWDIVAIAARGLTEAFKDYFGALKGFSEELPYTVLPSGPTPDLSRIYIEQLVEEYRAPEATASDEPREAAPEELAEEYRVPGTAASEERMEAGPSKRRVETPENALERHAHLLFEGGPGTGKSSLVSYLTLERVKAWERNKDASLVPVPVPARELATMEGAWSSRLRQQVNNQLDTWLQKDLPSNFFEQPPAPGASWLVMIDGLDEVVGQEQRNDLINLIKHHAKEGSEYSTTVYRFLVTTRPLSEVGSFEQDGFARRVMVPFEAGQLETFARYWFARERGDDPQDAQRFLQQVKQSRIADLAQVPLLLTMAAVLYEQNRGEPLPTSRTALYDNFVATLLYDEEAERETAESFRREWKKYWGKKGEDWADTLVSQRQVLLEHLALWQQQGGSDPLVDEAMRYAYEQGWLERPRNEKWLREQMKTLLRRTSLLTQRGDEQTFIHDTFREYLAASALAFTSEPNDEESWSYVSSWAEQSHREVVLFLLGIWSEKGKNVSGLVQRIRESSKNEGLLFVGTALSEGTKVDAEIEESIVQSLLVNAKKASDSDYWVPFYWNFSDPLDVLSALQSREPVTTGLLKLAQDPEVDVWTRTRVAEALVEIGRAEELAPALLSIVRDPEMYYSHYRSELVGVLVEIGRAEETTSALSALIRDSRASVFFRVDAAEDLAKLGQAEEAVSVLSDLANDPEGTVYDRVNAAKVLIKLDRAEEARSILSALARDTGLNSIDRKHAADALVEVGLVEEAATLLLAMARDPQLEATYRVGAAEELARLDRDEQAAQAWIALSCDKALDIWDRKGAARALEKIGRAEEAAQAWLVLACDSKVYPWERKEAISILGKQGYYSVLPTLERLAHAEPDQDIRAAAQAAVARMQQQT